MRAVGYLVNELRERPGEWGVVRVYNTANTARSTASKYRKEHPEVEWQVHETDNGQAKLFGRYREEQEMTEQPNETPEVAPLTPEVDEPQPDETTEAPVPDTGTPDEGATESTAVKPSWAR